MVLMVYERLRRLLKIVLYIRNHLQINIASSWVSEGREGLSIL